MINIFCVFLYTVQKQEMKYQKNNINKKLKTKKKANFIFKYLIILFVLFFTFNKFFSCFIINICFSERDNNFKIKLIDEEIKVE